MAEVAHHEQKAEKRNPENEFPNQNPGQNQRNSVCKQTFIHWF
jgi:hypothetical protein